MCIATYAHELLALSRHSSYLAARLIYDKGNDNMLFDFDLAVCVNSRIGKNRGY